MSQWERAINAIHRFSTYQMEISRDFKSKLYACNISYFSVEFYLANLSEAYLYSCTRLQGNQDYSHTLGVLLDPDKMHLDHKMECSQQRLLKENYICSHKIKYCKQSLRLYLSFSYWEIGYSFQKQFLRVTDIPRLKYLWEENPSSSWESIKDDSIYKRGVVKVKFFGIIDPKNTRNQEWIRREYWSITLRPCPSTVTNEFIWRYTAREKKKKGPPILANQKKPCHAWLLLSCFLSGTWQLIFAGTGILKIDLFVTVLGDLPMP